MYKFLLIITSLNSALNSLATIKEKSYIDGSNPTSIGNLVNATANMGFSIYYVNSTGNLSDWIPSEGMTYLTVMIHKTNAVATILITGSRANGNASQYVIKRINATNFWSKVSLTDLS